MWIIGFILILVGSLGLFAQLMNRKTSDGFPEFILMILIAIGLLLVGLDLGSIWNWQ